MRALLVVPFLALTLPSFVHGAVLINEIAWMGTEANVNDEWIELYNSGAEPVSVDGWVLTDGVSLDISLTGTIEEGEYAVLERTDDTTAPGPAFLIYTGALANDGRTLTLRRDDNSIEDQVAGGENWESIGGNNETKDTAQRTSAGWITAAPTPGAQNASVGTETGNTSGTTNPPPSASGNSTGGTKPVAKSSGSGSGVPFKPSTTELVLTLNAPRTAYVNQPVLMSVEPRGIGDTIAHSLVYSWSFGDTHAATNTKKVTHTYRHPGEYVIVARATFARHDAAIRHTITVLPVALSIGRTDAGDVLIQNTAPYEVDLTGFVLAGDRALTFPDTTIILENGTITIDRDRVESGPEKMLALYDRRKSMVASTFPESLLKVSTVPETVASAAISIERPKAIAVQTAKSVPTETVDVPEVHGVLPGTVIPIGNPQAAALAVAKSPMNDTLPYVGLVLLIVLAALVIFMKRGGHESPEIRG